MSFFRKRPVVIEAIKFTGHNQHEIDNFCSSVRCSFAGPGGPAFIKTLEGRMQASPGDWIIKGVAGEFYPCKPDIFNETYEAVDGL